MPFDGIFMHCVKCELENFIIGAKVDKIFEPSREEIVLSLRTRNDGNKKLLCCARADSARVTLTEASFENPQSPPMLCMLLRKRLGGATITGVRQQDCDRILFLDFLATNEMGDKEKLALAVEIMAQRSNVILLSYKIEDGKEVPIIIDALKRVDYTKSTYRLILPGVKYELPPPQNKINIFEESKDCKASQIMGVSPLVSRELELLSDPVAFLKEYKDGSDKYYLLKDENEKPFEFSFMPITQYGSAASVEEYESAAALLDDYYSRRESRLRMTQRTSDLMRVLQNTKTRIAKKLDIQKIELEKCADRETLRISAELINANLYKLQKGADFFDLENYYDDNKIMRVKVDPALSPAQNSQKYFKEYKKTYTAEKKLKEQIEIGIADLEYIETVIDALSRVENERDIAVIRLELVEQGYLKNKYESKGKLSKANVKSPSSLPPFEYETSDGYKVLVGRNNLQNEKLSLKQASKLDMWLHTKGFPGSHVIIENKDGKISDQAIEEAAVIAAKHSTAGESGAKKIPVDYTLVKNLKKPAGSRPGKVIFHENWTIYVDLT